MKIKIEFASWACKAALEIKAGNIKEAVEKVKALLLSLHDNDSLGMKVLEELDAFHENGKYYITSRLHMKDVPDELQDHVYTATAGYSWMSVWEFDARIMNDDQKNAMSYGKWLFATVDSAIEAYKVANGISDDDELFVEDKLVHSVPLRW